nr:receptor-like protein 12 [Ipomoea batatas]
MSLSHCNLSGSFPREIFLIHSLQELNLESNVDLSGDFPSFSENGSLRMISVGGTQFSGSLPPSISNLSNLSMINLSSCNFSGSIPSTMAQLTSLSYVDFSHNKFTGSIPNFPLSKKLTRIDFSFNGLTGPLSSKHFEGFSKVVFISLGSNYLSGKIPPSLFSLPSLKRLHLSDNSFDGFVDEYVNVSTSQLKKLDLSSNRLNESSFPKYFFEFPKLSELLLSSNSISGRIQSSLFSLPSLQALDLSDNLFDGLVDEYVNASAVSQLERLDLSSNRLNKSFPKYFFEFPNLSRLLLFSNSLGEWIMFEGLQKLGLEILDLSDNGIRGEIPSWIWGVGNGTLHHLDLSCNFLDGFEKPYTLPRCLTMLDLHSNQLRGPLPNAPVPRSGGRTCGCFCITRDAGKHTNNLRQF